MKKKIVFYKKIFKLNLLSLFYYQQKSMLKQKEILKVWIHEIAVFDKLLSIAIQIEIYTFDKVLFNEL